MKNGGCIARTVNPLFSVEVEAIFIAEDFSCTIRMDLIDGLIQPEMRV
jgi:hypothetical protein